MDDMYVIVCTVFDVATETPYKAVYGDLIATKELAFEVADDLKEEGMIPEVYKLVLV